MGHGAWLCKLRNKGISTNLQRSGSSISNLVRILIFLHHSDLAVCLLSLAPCHIVNKFSLVIDFQMKANWKVMSCAFWTLLWKLIVIVYMISVHLSQTVNHNEALHIFGLFRASVLWWRKLGEFCHPFSWMDGRVKAKLRSSTCSDVRQERCGRRNSI